MDHAHVMELSFGEAKEEACNNPNQNFVRLLGSKAKLKGSSGAGELSVALPSQSCAITYTPSRLLDE
jgi:hypothetical protein